MPTPQQRYYEKNKEKIRLQHKEYYELNKDTITKRTNSYYHETKNSNKEKRKEYDCLRNSNRQELNSINYKKYKDTVDGRYSSYKRDAKRRNIDFDISKEEFKIFWNVSCSYCGDQIETIGIDRIDNSKGYIQNNITSCCINCNKIKSVYKLDFMYKHIHKIIYNKEMPHTIRNQKNIVTIFKRYQKQAYERNLIFDIDIELFTKMLNTSCTYCNGENYIGVDRINSAGGYSSDNVTSCCKICNKMKLHHNVDNFYEHLGKMIGTYDANS